MLNYENGKHKLSFDTTQYDFKQLVKAELFRDTDYEFDLKDLHKINGIAGNIEKYRQALFSLFRKEEFQTTYKKFGAELIDEHFDGQGLIQKTPTVRIQLPGAESTSYHSDGWYGHGKSVRSFWLPLTKVGPGNTLYIAEDIQHSLDCMRDIISARATLQDINNIAKSICAPFEGDYGDLLSFSSDMIHGANRNSQDTTRVSFDFRIAPKPNDIGTKPLSNFFNRAELTSNEETVEKTTNTIHFTGITYSNLCNGVSAKSQLMMCAAFCDANNIGIVGNESEIVTFDYLPVLRHYLSSNKTNINSVVVFGVGIFNSDKDLAKSIIETAIRNDIALIFCSESIFLKTQADADSVLKLVSQSPTHQ